MGHHSRQLYPSVPSPISLRVVWCTRGPVPESALPPAKFQDGLSAVSKRGKLSLSRSFAEKSTVYCVCRASSYIKHPLTLGNRVRVIKPYPTEKLRVTTRALDEMSLFSLME